jgi:DNA-binding PadR family transcriptional regulator
MTNEILGGFQQLVMLAVVRLAEAAYGARIQDELEQTAGRSVSISTVYVTLDRLERRGYVASWLADPTPIRGGKSKRYYRVTKAGLDALRQSREELERMWQGVETSLEAGPPR